MAPTSGPPNLRQLQRDTHVGVDLAARVDAFTLAEDQESAIPRETFAWATLLFCGFLMYGSLLPFNYTPKTLDAALERFGGMPYLTLSLGQERADWVATILLWAPAGFLACGALAGRAASWPRKLAAALFVSVASAVYAVLVEFVQIWFPPRTISLNDILAATAGGVAGALFALAVGDFIDQAVRGLWQSRDSRWRGFWLLGAYTISLAIYGLVPLDFVVDASELHDKIRQGRCEWMPLTGVMQGSMPWYVPVIHVACWTPVGVWVVRLARFPNSWIIRLTLAVFAVLVLEVARFFVYSAYSSSTHLLAIMVGLLSGAVFAPASGVWEWFHRSRMGRFLCWSLWPVGVLLLLHAAAILFQTCRAADWNFDPQWMRSRWAGFFQAPLAAMYWNSKFGALENVVGKLAIYFPAGLLVAHAVRLASANARQRFGVTALGIAAVASVAATAEVLQVFLARFHVDLTDVLLAAAGASLGLLVHRLANGPAEIVGGTSLVELDAPRATLAAFPPRRSPWSMVSFFSLMMAGASISVVAGYERAHTDASHAPAWMTLLDPSKWNGSVVRASSSAPVATHAEPPANLSPSQKTPLDAAAEPPMVRPSIISQAKPLPTETHLSPNSTADSPGNPTRSRSPSAWFTRTPRDPFMVPKLTAAPLLYDKPIASIVAAPVRGRDGKLWFIAQESDEKALQVVLYDPATGHAEFRGDFQTAWSAAHSSEAATMLPTQVKVTSSLVISYGGEVYFATNHTAATGRPQSHVWRVTPSENGWKLVMSCESVLSAMAVGGESIYAWSANPPELWRSSGEGVTWRSLQLPASNSSYASRIFADDLGHVYLIDFPPVDEDLEEEHPMLVQLDGSLREVGRSELPAHGKVTDRPLLGVVADAALADGARVFANDVGFLLKVTASDQSKLSLVEPLGWLHPLGMSRVEMLATYDGRQVVCGVGKSEVDDPPVNHWLVLNIATGESRSAPLPMADQSAPPSRLLNQGGRDDAGRFYFSSVGEQQPVRIDPNLRRALLAIGASTDDIEAVAAETVIASPSNSLLFRVDFGVELERE
jgi:VanZ family protein